MEIEKIRKMCVIAFIIVGLGCIFIDKSDSPKQYEGEADGFNETIKVSITATKNRKGEVRISDIKYEHDDSPGIAEPAIEQLITKIKAVQDIKKVDVIAGATYSSEGFLMAVEDALKKIDE